MLITSFTLKKSNAWMSKATNRRVDDPHKPSHSIPWCFAVSIHTKVERSTHQDVHALKNETQILKVQQMVERIRLDNLISVQ